MEIFFKRLACFFIMSIGLYLTDAYAVNEEQSCTKIMEARERLACFDALAIPQAAPVIYRSYLTRSWDLDDQEDKMLGDEQSPLSPHRGSYLIVRRTSEANVLPYSPTHAVATTNADIDLNEIKFQFSQKAKMFNPVRLNIPGITGFRLWGAYTQQSNWQAINSGNSSPFRETNYEPELILTFNTGHQYGMKLFNLGYVHQSNGRDSAASRSWNRTYLQGGWENNTFSLLVRRWWRIAEDIAQDDNPDIEEYLGFGEFKLRWEPLDHSQVINLTLRNNFKTDINRGFIQLDWSTPIALSSSTKLNIQFTSGYGESLIDYNYAQTTFGLGVSFRDW